RFASHEGDGVRRRPNERQSLVDDRFRELFVFSQESVSGMHRIGARGPSGFQDPLDIQIAFARSIRTDRARLVGKTDVERRTVALRVHGNGGDAHFAARADDSHGDFAAIGNENLVQRRRAFRLAPVFYWLEGYVAVLLRRVLIALVFEVLEGRNEPFAGIARTNEFVD